MIFSSFSVTPHLSQGDDEAAQRLLLAGEADVVGGNKHLSQNVYLVKGSPQGAVCVPIQFFIFGQTEQRPVTLALGSRVQISEKLHIAFKDLKQSSSVMQTKLAPLKKKH